MVPNNAFTSFSSDHPVYFCCYFLSKNRAGIMLFQSILFLDNLYTSFQLVPIFRVFCLPFPRISDRRLVESILVTSSLLLFRVLLIEFHFLFLIPVCIGSCWVRFQIDKILYFLPIFFWYYQYFSSTNKNSVDIIVKKIIILVFLIICVHIFIKAAEAFFAFSILCLFLSLWNIPLGYIHVHFFAGFS